MRLGFGLVLGTILSVACAPNTTTETRVTAEQVQDPKTHVGTVVADPEPEVEGVANPFVQPEDPVAEREKPDVADIAAAVMNPDVEMPEEVREALASVELDPYPEALVLDAHYWVSNEHHHFLYKPYIDNHKGIYLGVGTDQNYLLAAWARSPVLLMMDFDEQVRNVHDIYGVIFRRAETPAEMMRLWTSAGEAEVMQWIAEDFQEKRVAELQKTYKTSRGVIHGRLRKVRNDYKTHKIATFLSDQDQYTFLRNLWLKKRVFAYRGDLTANATMVQISNVLKKYDLNMGLMYLSNAEQYFDFTPEFRRNIIAQPFAENSWILRTRPWEELGYPEGGNYHYNIQAGQNFSDWLMLNTVKNASRLLAGYRTNDKNIPGISVVKRPAVASSMAPKVALMPE